MSFIAELNDSADLFSIHCQHPRDFPFLFESLSGHPLADQFDLLLACPGERIDGAGWFDRLNRAFAAEALEAQTPALPFVGGWFLMLGYEAAMQAESCLRLPPADFGLPDAIAVRCRAAVMRDRQHSRLTVFAESAADGERIVARIKGCDHHAGRFAPASLASIHEEPAVKFLKGVEKVQEYLRAGDAFQVNLSRRWHGELADGGDYRAIYARLRQVNPAPFAGLAVFEDRAVLSSSPERLVAVTDGLVQTRPIAGTRPRTADQAKDLQQQLDLRASSKERAEHIMLIDLERNDLGRVCEPGSIDVSELMTLESYAHVHHIVSNVRGRLRKDAGPGDVLRAVFPGGTITGCPKIRAMEIIAELEGEGRGPYTGSMGYLSRCGRMDSNILIRSIVCGGQQVSLRAGAGIVTDSNAQKELEETRAKARGLLMALGAEV